MVKPDTLETLVNGALDGMMVAAQAQSLVFTSGELYSAVLTLCLRTMAVAKNVGEEECFRPGLEKLYAELPAIVTN
jgi:hypothetical protein